MTRRRDVAYRTEWYEERAGRLVPKFYESRTLNQHHAALRLARPARTVPVQSNGIFNVIGDALFEAPEFAALELRWHKQIRADQVRKCIDRAARAADHLSELLASTPEDEHLALMASALAEFRRYGTIGGPHHCPECAAAGLPAIPARPCVHILGRP